MTPPYTKDEMVQFCAAYVSGWSDAISDTEFKGTKNNYWPGSIKMAQYLLGWSAAHNLLGTAVTAKAKK